MFEPNFHVCKIYTIFRLCDPDWIPEEHIDEIAMLEPQGQDGPCVKPAAALDLMLHSRKGPYQSLMAREDVRIKRVPTALAYALARELEARVQFDNIYFAKLADPEAPKWQVFDRHDPFGDLDTEFKDVVLKFNPGRRPQVPRRARPEAQAQVSLQRRGAAARVAALRVGLCPHGPGRVES